VKKKLPVLFVFLLIILIPLFLWWQQAAKAVNKADSALISFTISQGETVRQVADRLNRGVHSLFKKYGVDPEKADPTSV